MKCRYLPVNSPKFESFPREILQNTGEERRGPEQLVPRGQLAFGGKDFVGDLESVAERGLHHAPRGQTDVER